VLKIDDNQAYSMYVASSIHVRVASQGRADSDAHRYLAVCLDGLEQNSHVNVGLRAANSRIHGLMEKLGVSMEGEEVGQSRSSSSPRSQFDDEVGISPGDLDLDAIIRSFDFPLPQMENIGGSWSSSGFEAPQLATLPDPWWPEQDNLTGLQAFFGRSTAAIGSGSAFTTPVHMM
jgi:hypothetical protein